LNHFDTWHNYEVTHVKKLKIKKKTKNWHVMLTLTSFGQTNDKDKIESFKKKQWPNWDRKKLEDQIDIIWQIQGPKE